jgi:hypothetical protein
LRCAEIHIARLVGHLIRRFLNSGLLMTEGSGGGASSEVSAFRLDGQASTIAITATAAASTAPAPYIQRDYDGAFAGSAATSGPGAGASSAKRAASRAMWVASLPEKASIHCVPEMNSWSARRLDILDAHGDDRLLLADRPFDLARHEVGLVARARQNENEGRGSLDAPDDLIAVGGARLHVAQHVTPRSSRQAEILPAFLASPWRRK